MFPAPSLTSAHGGAIGWARDTGETVAIVAIGPVGHSVIAEVEPTDTLGRILSRSNGWGG